ncbi:hypothetical protein H5410_061074 [Solanum commersonii]|uniref:Uncharacterized protein n=1 Tax=Solanum commersonii TaxID=4109 RepID=A0A9J5W7V5_SOLCO|nr:hypothetical protein H5410_061074 [Solanum commersonii]
MDEYAEMMPPSKTQKMSSSGSASSTARNAVVVELDEEIYQLKKFGETGQDKICNGLLNFESYVQPKEKLENSSLLN